MQNDQGSQTPPVPLAQGQTPVQPNQPIPNQPNTAEGTGAAQVQPQPLSATPQGETASPQAANAPENMIKRDPSVFEPPAEGKAKPKRKGMFFACCCSAIILIILAVGGIGAYAYYSDADIPIISDIVDQLVGLIKDPKKEAANATEKAASTLIGAVIPLMTKDESLVSAFAKNTMSEDYIKSYMESYEDIQSLRYDLDMKMVYTEDPSRGNDSRSSGMFSNMDINLVGAMNMKEEGNEKLEAAFDANITSEDMPMDFQGEFKAIGSDSYIKLDSYPSLYSAFIGSIEEKWISLESSDVEETTELFGRTEESGEENEIKEEDIDKLMEFITDETVVKNAEFLPDEEIEGNACSCVKIYWNQEELKEVMKKYNEIYENEYTEEELNKSVEAIDYMEVVTCIGKESNMVHKIGIKIEGEEDGNDISVEISLKLWDYGSDMTITAPTDYITLDEVIESSMPSYDDYDYDDYEDFDYESLLEEYE